MSPIFALQCAEFIPLRAMMTEPSFANVQDRGNESRR
jgi:hypothetical protein